MDRELVESCLLSYRDKNVCVKRSKSGLGVFAICDLSPGTQIGDYQGEIMAPKMVREREDTGFRMEIGDDTGLYIDPIDETGRTKYICVCNYINEPAPDERCNAAFFMDTINSRIYVRMVRPARQGDEILLSYGSHFPRHYRVNEMECSYSGDHWVEVLRESGGLEEEHSASPDQPHTDGEPVCQLCGKEANVEAGPIQDFSGTRVHRRCAVWSSEVFEDHRSHELQNVDTAVRRGRRLRCAYCDLRGASIGCAHPKCRRSYHYSCAFLDECLINAHLFVVCCREHVAFADTLDLGHNPDRLGSGEVAVKSFKLCFPDLSPAELKQRLSEQIAKTTIIRDLERAPLVEAFSTQGVWRGSWWPARVLGMYNEVSLIRYAGYDADDDEWVLSSTLRLPTKAITSCSEVEVGKTYLLFSGAGDWRDGEILRLKRHRDCPETDECQRCWADVRYASNAGRWANIRDTIGPLCEKVSPVYGVFNGLQARQEGNMEQDKPKAKSVPKRKLRELGDSDSMSDSTSDREESDSEGSDFVMLVAKGKPQTRCSEEDRSPVMERKKPRVLKEDSRHGAKRKSAHRLDRDVPTAATPKRGLILQLPPEVPSTPKHTHVLLPNGDESGSDGSDGEEYKDSDKDATADSASSSE